MDQRGKSRAVFVASLTHRAKDLCICLDSDYDVFCVGVHRVRDEWNI